MVEYVNKICCKSIIESASEKFLKSVNIWGSYGQVWLSCFFDSRCTLGPKNVRLFNIPVKPIFDNFWYVKS